MKGDADSGVYSVAFGHRGVNGYKISGILAETFHADFLDLCRDF